MVGRPGAIGSNDVARPTSCPLTRAAAKLARPIAPSGSDPGSAPGPAADVGRIEQVLAQPPAPVGQHRRARRRVEHSRPGPRPRRTRSGSRPLAEVGRLEEQPRSKHRLDAPADVEVVSRSPSASSSRSCECCPFLHQCQHVLRRGREQERGLPAVPVLRVGSLLERIRSSISRSTYPGRFSLRAMNGKENGQRGCRTSEILAGPPGPRSPTASPNGSVCRSKAKFLPVLDPS